MVGCHIVLLPCAFGMVALNLARLIILHGSVLVALVTYLNLPSFIFSVWFGRYRSRLWYWCCAWLVGSCARDSLVPCPSMICACLYHGPSYLAVYWSCPLALPLGLPCLRGLPLWVWLSYLVCLGLCPLVSFFRCWLVFRWLLAPTGVVWAPWPPDAMESFVPVGLLP